ncbi:MAG: metallophosphoesterase [Methanomicrobiales archaeon]
MKIRKILFFTIILVVLIVGYMFIEPYLVETKEVVIESDQIPPEFDGKKIVYLADIHAGPFYSTERIDNLVKQVNKMNPDLILMGGDYVDREDIYIDPVFDSLENLNAPLGVYGVLGNNDPQYFTLKRFNESPITYIGNKGEWIEINGSKIRICGVGDYNNGYQYPKTALGDAKKEDFVIFLTHNPDYFPEIDQSMVDLVLTGHTHGGQVTLFGLWAPIPRSDYGQKYLTGVKKYNNTTLIISNGLGTVILPVRFFARPQIIVVKLKRIN